MKRQRPLILNVDDADAGRYAKSRTLKLAGYDVIEAANGTDALRLVKEAAPDAMLLDVQLPDINGLEVCKRVKTDPLSSAIPVLQISASHIGNTDKVRGLENGADAYLTEPMDPEVLIATLTALIRARNAEEALREMNRRKDSFLTSLSHEIRNTLAPLRNALNVICDDAATPDQSNRSKEVMSRQIGYLTRLIEDLLDVARLNENKISLEMESVSTNSILMDVAQDYASIWEKNGIQFKLVLPTEEIFVNADSVRLQQVITNLLHNANKFTDPGGFVTMSLSKVSDGMLQIRVSDTGIGIDTQTIQHIFERFTQGEMAYMRTKTGLGLGLSLAHGLTALHNGTLRAESEGLGKGTTFVLTLPISHDPIPVVVESISAVKDKMLRVLIVDDNVDAGDTLGMLVELHGHSVKIARGAESAIQIAREFVPELMVCDIGLPGMSGYAVVEVLRKDQQLARTTFVALTGFGSDEDVAKSMKAGFHYHLTKPFGIEELEKIMQKI